MDKLFISVYVPTEVVVIYIPDFVSKRWSHSLSSFVISSHCTWLVVVGGADDENYITHPNIAMIVELGKFINYYMLIIFIQYIMIVNGLWDVY